MKPLESATETRPSVDQVSEATIPQSRAAASPLAPSPEEGNLGLDLYIAQTIARSHGGSIRAEPTSDRPGATFVVDLPLLGR